MEQYRYLWASPHAPTEEQLKDLHEGTVFYLKDIDPELFNGLVHIKLDDDLSHLAKQLVELCCSRLYVLVQPGGSPAFQAHLGMALMRNHMLTEDRHQVDCMYAFSNRISEDIPQPDSSVKKISIFKHEGWVIL